MTFENKRLAAILLAVSAVLLVPLIAMQFTDEVRWSNFDFSIAGTLLFTAAIGCEFVLRMVKSNTQRIAILAVILAALALVWIEIAVGVFGTPFAGS
ncbi:MAG: hypothetical protein R2681_17345 [Pyrinomonadaceae bacterium]